MVGPDVSPPVSFLTKDWFDLFPIGTIATLPALPLRELPDTPLFVPLSFTLFDDIS